MRFLVGSLTYIRRCGQQCRRVCGFLWSSFATPERDGHFAKVDITSRSSAPVMAHVHRLRPISKSWWVAANAFCCEPRSGGKTCASEAAVKASAIETGSTDAHSDVWALGAGLSCRALPVSQPQGTIVVGGTVPQRHRRERSGQSRHEEAVGVERRAVRRAANPPPTRITGV